jgi:sugar transferase (PEP-CTERM system associated)
MFLMMIEAGLIVIAMTAAAKLRFWDDPASFVLYTKAPVFNLQVLTVVITLQICFYYNNLYDLASIQSQSRQFVRLGRALGAACLLLGVLYYFVPGLLVGRGVLFIAVAITSTSTVITRLSLDGLWSLASTPKNVLILGDGELAANVAREFARRRDLNYRLAGFVNCVSNDQPAAPTLFGRPVLGNKDELGALVRVHKISRIVVAIEDMHHGILTEDLFRLRIHGIEIEDAHSALAGLTGRIWLSTVRPSWFVFSDGFRRSASMVFMKRTFDLAFGILGLTLSLPLMAAIALAVRLDSEGPALYRQPRVGLGGKVFQMLKFRSMRMDAEDNGPQWAEENDPRSTRLGRWLRRYRLDELPQFMNVVRGEMSLVGPRPERLEFVEELRDLIPFYDERHAIPPGLTGWAQVEYSYGASVAETARKLEYDLFYLKNMSVLFDLAIVLRTIGVVFGGRGAR